MYCLRLYGSSIGGILGLSRVINPLFGLPMDQVKLGYSPIQAHNDGSP